MNDHVNKNTYLHKHFHTFSLQSTKHDLAVGLLIVKSGQTFKQWTDWHNWTQAFQNRQTHFWYLMFEDGRILKSSEFSDQMRSTCGLGDNSEFEGILFRGLLLTNVWNPLFWDWVMCSVWPPTGGHQCVSQFWGHIYENTQWRKVELCARPVTQCGPPVCVTGDRASITDDQLGCSAWAIISIACHNIARAQCIEQRKAAQSRGGEERGEQHSGARCEDYLIGRLLDQLWKHLSLLSSHCPLPPLGYLSILPACHPPGWKKNENAL